MGTVTFALFCGQVSPAPVPQVFIRKQERMCKMKNSILETTFRRMFTRPHFYISVSLFVFLYFLLFFATIGNYNLLDWDILHTIDAVISSHFTFLLAFAVIPPFAFAAVYAEDHTQGMVSFWTLRSGCRKYALSQFSAAMLGGFLVVFCGMWLFIGILSFFLPIMRDYQGNFNSVFASSLINDPEGSHPFAYLLLQTSQYALSGAMFSAFAAWVGSLIPDRLVVFSSAVVLYFALYNIPISSFFSLPFNQLLWLSGVCDNQNGQWLPPYLEKWAVAIVMGILLGFLTQSNVVRRQRHE